MAVSRGTAVAAGIGVALLGVALLRGSPNDGPPLDPRSDGPLGTSALVSLLDRLGAEVDLSAGLPEPGDDVALLLADRLDEDQAAEVRAWVRRGGTLVVTDPASAFAPAEVLPGNPLDTGTLDRGICTISALEGVEVVDGGAASRFATTTADASCVGSRAFAFVVATSEGDGEIVAIGGAAFVTNDQLAQDDNAVLAAALLAPRAGADVRIVDAPLPAGGGDKTLSDLVSDGVRRAGLQLGIAFALYALWRAVRLGRPAQEPQAVEIAGSELVGATGRLLERGRAPAASAEVLRERLRRALRARLGVPSDVPTAALVQVVAERTGLDPADVHTAIGDHAVTTDDELVAVARAVASVHQEVLH